MSKIYLIIDVKYLCYRTRWAMGNDLSYMGTPTTIIYGFLKDLIGLQDKFRTRNLLFCFDSKTSRRKKLYPEYKANRHKKELTDEEFEFEMAFQYQIVQLRKKYLSEIGYRNIFQVKGLEADDIMASLANKLTKYKTEDRGILVTADQDLYQCISHNVTFYSPSSQKELTLQGFTQKYGIHASQWAMVKAIAGCSTDNVGGVIGVGEKTAIKYITGELGTKTKANHFITNDKGKEIIKRNKTLVKLPFKGTPKFKIEKDELSIEGWKRVCKQLGFKSFTDVNPFPWK